MVADDKVEIYSCYGNSRHIVIDGRVFDSKEKLKYEKSDTLFTNLKNKLSQIFNDEKENAEITISINQNKYQIISDQEGYYSFELSTQQDSFRNNQTIQVSINGGKTVASCRAFIPSKDEQVGVISDFDDTLVISDVVDKISLIKNLLFKNYKQRTLVKEMQEIINSIITDSIRAFFVITGSPKQLHNAINNFLDYHNFPKRTIITKKLHGDNSDPIFDQLEYKFEKVRNIILLYPHIKWVLLGDSGEMDKEVYTQIKKAYPNSVKSIYIRNVKNGEIEKILP